MILTFFDTETTGLDTFNSDIIQFAYLQTDTNSGFIRANCFNLWEDDYTWSEDAYKVHGFSKSYLQSLPIQDMYKKYDEMFVVMSRANVAGYNSEHFDYPLVQSFMARHAVKPEPINQHFDVMKIAQNAFGKRRKLVELTAQLGITEATVQRMTEIFFNRPNTQAHDAAYDTVATLLCFERLRSNGNVQI